MKIGILTTYFAYNFGAMLQPFALKRTLEQMGHDVEMIRYKQEAVYNYYSPISWRHLFSRNPFRGLRYAMYLMKNYMVLKQREVNFKRFMLKHITDTDSFYTTIPADKDVYFIGSDQLWNPYNLGGFDEVYMGNFHAKVDAIKATYAISAGSLDFNDHNIEYLNAKFRNFDYISVREDSLRENLAKYTECKNAETVLDPTLLAEPSLYNELETINPLPGDDFIMLYYIRDCSKFLERLCSLAEKRKYRLLVLSEGVKADVVAMSKRHNCIKYMPEAGEEIFLGGIMNAKCVFTPSFHGIVFSIIYKRPFYSLELADNNNRRAQDLLATLGLKDRIMRISDTPEINDCIDFTTCDQILNIERQKSLKFINKVINKN